jgi:hypothetical protein
VVDWLMAPDTAVTVTTRFACEVPTDKVAVTSPLTEVAGPDTPESNAPPSTLIVIGTPNSVALRAFSATAVTVTVAAPVLASEAALTDNPRADATTGGGALLLLSSLSPQEIRHKIASNEAIDLNMGFPKLAAERWPASTAMSGESGRCKVLP